MKILIVDDSVERVRLIQSSLAESENFKYLDVSYCDSADGARAHLTTALDLLVLDILIPKKTDATPQALHSLNLLSDVCNPKKKYISPRLVIGLTADLSELGAYQEQFAKEASIVLRGSLIELSWLDSLHAQIDSLLGAQRKLSQQQKRTALITVHGIRTYGHWQAKLGSEISQYSRTFEYVEIKYGFLDLISFAIPFLREKVIRIAAERLRLSIKEHAHLEIYLVAHSFGTLIVSYALRERLSSERLKGVVLCGSPLPGDTNIDHIVGSAEITLNECGTRDFVLVLARLLIWGLGDAGRTGFRRENSSGFRNRYFKGGHSLYFKRFGDSSTFYEKFWLRFIALGEEPKKFDARVNYLGEDVVDISLKLLTFMKPFLYIVVSFLAIRGLIQLV